MVVGPDEMAAINGEHRDKPTPTDVLAFPVDGPDALDWPADGPPPELGDVVICPELGPGAARRRSRSTGCCTCSATTTRPMQGEMLALQDRLVDEAP